MLMDLEWVTKENDQRTNLKNVAFLPVDEEYFLLEKTIFNPTSRILGSLISSNYILVKIMKINIVNTLIETRLHMTKFLASVFCFQSSNIKEKAGVVTNKHIREDGILHK